MAKLRESRSSSAVVEPPEHLVNFHWQQWDESDGPLPATVARFGERLQFADEAKVGWFRRVLAGRERWFAARQAWSRRHGVDLDGHHPPPGQARRRGQAA